MNAFLNSFKDIIIVLLISAITTLFVFLFVYLLQKIKSTDYSDQTGWLNFARPFLGIALIILTIQAIIAGIVFLYLYLTRQI